MSVAFVSEGKSASGQEAQLLAFHRDPCGEWHEDKAGLGGLLFYCPGGAEDFNRREIHISIGPAIVQLCAGAHY